MAEDNQNPYDILASFYDDAGFSNYSSMMASRLLTFLQQQGWMGRRVLDLGCGTGLGVAFFASHAMEVTGIDSSAEMLGVAERRFIDTDFSIMLKHQDMADGDYGSDADLIISLGNVFNEFQLPQIVNIFKHCHAALSPGKLLVFDMSTIRGLAEQFANNDQVLEISDNLFMTVQNYFNYEAISVRQRIIAFVYQDHEWHRYQTTLTMRSFPFASITKLLEKSGFTVKGAYDSNLRSFDVNRDVEGRFIIVAERNQ